MVRCLLGNYESEEKVDILLQNFYIINDRHYY